MLELQMPEPVIPPGTPSPPPPIQEPDGLPPPNEVPPGSDPMSDPPPLTM